MFIGHLPAGYLLTSVFVKYMPPPARTRLMAAGLAGAIAPDLDLFWCYLVDNAQRHHHMYPSHWPLLWFSALAALLAWMGMAKNKQPALLGVVFCLNAIVHLLLDTLVGDIWWLMPFVNQPWALFHVPALYHPWWLNFFLHWSFMLELALVAAAIWLWIYKRKGSSVLVE